MRGEKEKMLAGEWFDPHDAELTADRDRATRLMHRLNVECCGHGDDYRTTLGELCPNVRGFIREPFHCDYGYNIHLGHHFYANTNCVFLDCAEIRIGNYVFLGPNVQLYAATHPLDPECRRQGIESAHPITIGDDVWIGGNTVINAGVTIGPGTTIGSGSVVTKDIPPNVLAAGNPCRVIRQLK